MEFFYTKSTIISCFIQLETSLKRQPINNYIQIEKLMSQSNRKNH